MNQHKENPAGEGRGVDHVGSGDLNTIYGSAEENATADVAVGVRECRSCAAFFPYENGQGECRRYAPRPDQRQTMLWHWPQLSAGEFCGEYRARDSE